MVDVCQLCDFRVEGGTCVNCGAEQGDGWVELTDVNVIVEQTDDPFDTAKDARVFIDGEFVDGTPHGYTDMYIVRELDEVGVGGTFINGELLGDIVMAGVDVRIRFDDPHIEIEKGNPWQFIGVT